ncbi:DUF2306 domain-containing protein [Phenylobacterium sp. CCH12-B4]|uniref:DUF2306 domain-containing protein n=1 Tax=Phenylobacterium sp. CCH12-B4 TaxID=1768784 RepID=UPI0009EAD400|nr:DUF2306 domain-containing protein [Phenylobacterium sp. CCH12-B4]
MMEASAPPPPPRRTLRWALVATGVVSLALGGWIVILNADAIAGAVARSRGAHAPDLRLLFAQPAMVVTHVMLAVSATGLGAVMLASRKGAPFHRRAGWVWIALMAGVALSSFFLTSLNGGLSYIHVMSALTLILLPFAAHAARRHAVRSHRALMLWLFWLMLVGAAAFTLVPGRLMWDLFFA